MSESSDLAAMLCGGSPEKHETASIGQLYINGAVLFLLRETVMQCRDPRAKATELLQALHASVKSKIDDDLKQLQTVHESSMGKMFGSILPHPVETAARMQDRQNEVHATIAQFLLSGLTESESFETQTD